MKRFFKEGEGVTSIICVAWSLYQIYSSAFAVLNPYLRYSIHLCFAMVLVWLVYPITTKSKVVTKIIKIGLPLLSVCVFGYVGLNYQEISERIPRVTPLSYTEIVFAVIAIILLIEATRRSIGIPLAAVCAFFLLYAYCGKYIPGSLGHGGYSVESILDYVYFSSEGVWGLSLRISATYLFLFILYAEVIKECGVGDFFMGLAKAVAGGMRGGPAQIGVLGSCLFGMISGSAVANVMAVGAFTIPLMKKIGYEPAFAGAVEAYASTGGQLMPPIMAATAFVMAEFMGVSYWTVCIMAFIPALLYYFCGGVQIFFEAHKRNLKSIPKEERPRLVDVLKKGSHQTIPIIALLAGLAMGFSEERTVLWSMLIAVVVSFFRKETRMTPARIIHALDQAARSAVMIAVSCAAVGIVLAIFVLGGLGVALTQMIFKLGAGIPILTALLIAAVCFVLGMGMPTLPAYVITAALGVPVLTTVGFKLEASPSLRPLLFGAFDDHPPCGHVGVRGCRNRKGGPVDHRMEGGAARHRRNSRADLHTLLPRSAHERQPAPDTGFGAGNGFCLHSAGCRAGRLFSRTDRLLGTAPPARRICLLPGRRAYGGEGAGPVHRGFAAQAAHLGSGFQKERRRGSGSLICQEMRISAAMG